MTSDETEEIRVLLDAGDVDINRQETLANLYSRHRDRLRRMIEFRLDARLRGRVSTSDVLQEAYIDALKRLPHFQGRPGGALLHLAPGRHHSALDSGSPAAPRGGRPECGSRGVAPRPAGPEASSEMMAEFIADVTSPSQAVQRIEVMSQLRGSLDHLDPIDREVLALRHFRRPEQPRGRRHARAFNPPPPASAMSGRSSGSRMRWSDCPALKETE